MQRNQPLFVLLAALLVAACSGESDVPGPVPEDSAEALITTFQSTLTQTLGAAISSGGAAHAISVCSEAAPQVAVEQSTAELTIRRIGTRARNARLNTPTPAEREVLERMTPESPVFSGELDGRHKYLRGIYVKLGICLQCHGQPDELEPEVREALAQLYPGDEATGYSLGDLRGAFVVEWR